MPRDVASGAALGARRWRTRRQARRVELPAPVSHASPTSGAAHLVQSGTRWPPLHCGVHQPVHRCRWNVSHESPPAGARQSPQMTRGAVTVTTATTSAGRARA